MEEESEAPRGHVFFSLDPEEFEYYFQIHGQVALVGEPLHEGNTVIVCFCITSNDRDIAAAIATGAHTVEQVGEQCGAGTGCGSCREFIQEMIEASGADCPGGGRCSECPRSGGPRPGGPRPGGTPEPTYGHSSLHAA